MNKPVNNTNNSAREPRWLTEYAMRLLRRMSLNGMPRTPRTKDCDVEKLRASLMATRATLRLNYPQLPPINP